MSKLVLLSIGIYGLAIVISFVVAAMIKGIVMALPMVERRAKAQPMSATVAPATTPTAIPPEHVAAIGAAVTAMLGEHHIIHIEDRGRGAVWAAEGRIMHQTSHAISRGSKR